MVSFSEASSDSIYIGQTWDFEDRRKSHSAHFRAARHEGDAMVHKFGRDAKGGKKMCPLVLFRHGDPEMEHFARPIILEAAELTAVCLFQSWSAGLIRSTPAAGSGGQITIAYEYAKRYNNLMEKIKAETSWRPVPSIGLNWKTPALCHVPRERMWLSYYDWQERAYVYRYRASMAVYSPGTRNQQHYLLWRSREGKVNIPKHVFELGPFQNGEPVTLVAELAHDGRQYIDHAVPWVRVPRPCHNREFERLRSLGLYLEWTDKNTGTWRRAPLQVTQARKHSQGEWSQLIQGMTLLAAITQTTYTGAPGWFPPPDRVTVRTVNMDHLRQEAWLDQNPVPGKVKSWPANSSLAYNTQRIRDAIPAEWVNDVIIGRKPAPGAQANAVKGNRWCDLCMSFFDTTACDYNEAAGTCKTCERFHRPCTWTNAKGTRLSELLMTDGPLQALGCPTNVQGTQDKASVQKKLDKVTHYEAIDTPPTANLDEALRVSNEISRDATE